MKRNRMNGLMPSDLVTSAATVFCEVFFKYGVIFSRTVMAAVVYTLAAV